jgi:hypothetical protein
MCLTTLHPSEFFLLPFKKRRVPPGERSLASSDAKPRDQRRNVLKTRSGTGNEHHFMNFANLQKRAPHNRSRAGARLKITLLASSIG